jgi:hypothetical protein
LGRLSAGAGVLGLQRFPAYLMDFFKYPVVIDGRALAACGSCTEPLATSNYTYPWNRQVACFQI